MEFESKAAKIFRHIHEIEREMNRVVAIGLRDSSFIEYDLWGDPFFTFAEIERICEEMSGDGSVYLWSIRVDSVSENASEYLEYNDRSDKNTFRVNGDWERDGLR